jgi:hypothetical protein
MYMGQNKYYIFNWIKKVIDSCETSTQLTKTNKLIKSFYNLYNDWDLESSLYSYKHKKSIKLIYNKTQSGHEK